MIRGLERIRSALFGPRETAEAGQFEALLRAYGGSQTEAGVAITPEKALEVPAVASCVTILSEAVSGLPLILYRRRDDGGRERATDHPLYAVLHDRPNPWMTSAELRSCMQADIETHGFGIAQIVRLGRRGRELIELHPIEASRVTPERVGSEGHELEFKVAPRAGEIGGARTLKHADALYVPGPMGDGYSGVSLIQRHRELFGVAYAIDRYLGSSLRNGVKLSGSLTTEKALSDKAYSRLKEWLQERYVGWEKVGKVAILEEGLGFTPHGQTHKDAQIVELSRMVNSAIAQVWRMPLHKLAQHINQPRANMEQYEREFVSHTLRSRLVRWEQRIQLHLLGNDPDLYAEHLLDGLLRGDMKTEAEQIALLIQWGVMTRNEARRIKNMNPLPGLDEPLRPLNMASGEESEEPEGSRESGSPS